jgi:hypothetical protein
VRVQELFNRYYDTVMPLLSNILTHASSKEYQLLRAKALECISLVGMAVGKERFRMDARKVMAYMQVWCELLHGSPRCGALQLVRAQGPVLISSVLPATDRTGCRHGPGRPPVGLHAAGRRSCRHSAATVADGLVGHLRARDKP